MKIALIHYAYIPVIGGVEFVMEEHANLLTAHGYTVKVLCGRGERNIPGEQVVTIPELFPGHESVVASQSALEAGEFSSTSFTNLVDTLQQRFREELRDCDVAIVHNMLTMHFNLAATAALWRIAEEMPHIRFINWIHDLVAINPDYQLPTTEEHPWKLLSSPPPHFHHIAISPRRAREAAQLYQIPPEQCPVIENGVESIHMLGLSEPVARFCAHLDILDKEIVILHPTRILRRKNIELGIRVLHALKKRGHQCLYLTTGAPDPHHPAAKAYGDELKRLIIELGVEREFLFVSNFFKVGDHDLLSLYSLSDMLFLPSRQEGFGLPVLEAGLFRIPIFCSDIDPLNNLLEHNIHLFPLEDPPQKIAEDVAHGLAQRPGYLSRKEVLRRYSWERLFREKIQPLLSDHYAETKPLGAKNE